MYLDIKRLNLRASGRGGGATPLLYPPTHTLGLTVTQRVSQRAMGDRMGQPTPSPHTLSLTASKKGEATPLSHPHTKFDRQPNGGTESQSIKNWRRRPALVLFV